MRKTYIADTHVSISVRFDNGSSNHIAFTPRSNGQSVFITESEDLQKAIENHHRFGKTIHLYIEPEPVAVPETQNEPVDPNAKKKVVVASLDDAKQYLVEKFGVSRTKIRGLESLKKCADENNVEFVGLE